MQAFVTVADLGGFAPAARKLGLSPSGLTRLIAALEERLGARLLQRTTRKVALTDAGTRYLVRVRRILADVEEAEGAAEGEQTRPGGLLVVSAPLGFGRLHVSPVVTAYLQRYPEVVLRSPAVGPHDQSGGGRRRSRHPHRASCRIPRWWRAMSARCGASWWPQQIISGGAASRRRRRTSPRHRHGPVRRHDSHRRMALRRRRQRDPHRCHAALCHQQR